MKTKEELKKYFENGDIPVQEEFWEWQDSYWHKNDLIPINQIQNSGQIIQQNSSFNDYMNPTLEVGALAISGSVGFPTGSTIRGRTDSFLDIVYANQIELLGDMLLQTIFYYSDTNVFISKQDINAKTFTPTIPATAKKWKVSLHHIDKTQTVTQPELNAIKINCYSSKSITFNDIVENAKASIKVISEYNNLEINLGENIPTEIGRIAVNNGFNSTSDTGIRTALIPVVSGKYLISQKSGYKISRVVFYKDGIFANQNVTTNDFSVDNLTSNQVRIVFEKNTPTEIVTEQDRLDFTYILKNISASKYDQLLNESKKSKPLPSTIYTINEQVAILNTNDTDINFDLANRKIIISGGAIIDTGNTTVGRISLPISTAGIDLPSAITAGVVLYNKTNNTIIVQSQTSAPLLNHLILFTYRYSGAFTTFYVTGLKNYSVNGVPVSQKDTRQMNKFAVDNFGIKYWSAPVYPAFNPLTLTSDVLYPMYDRVIAPFSNNVTKTVIGQTEGPAPYDILRIDISFNRKMPPTQRRRKPRIFVCAGTHGGEKLSVYTTYLFFKLLLENPNKDEMIDALRTNYDWTLIPLVNPYALNVGNVSGTESVRWNHNGVDINRNFDYRWAEYADGGAGSQSYKGTAPFSEKESQLVRDTFNAIKTDTVLFIDCHNFGSGVNIDYRAVWFASSFNTVQNAIYSLCDRLDAEIRKRYSYLADKDLLAFSDIDGSSPMSQAWMGNQQVVAMTMETDQSDYYNPTDPTSFNNNVITRSIETYVNTFYSMGKYAVDFYNNRMY
ncbi:M14 family metallopeptidase [Chryseobacterium indologenes]|uniref:M14 family metallopeptidase n=1 Tax=Chryseobacterium indologenes TaxID=253 RepID=UPI001BCD4D43|nr:M14 family metallopeptidase [Chryseobacterium indologenes]